MTAYSELREKVEGASDFDFAAVVRANELSFLRWMDAHGLLWPWDKERLRILEAKDTGHG